MTMFANDRRATVAGMLALEVGNGVRSAEKAEALAVDLIEGQELREDDAVGALLAWIRIDVDAAYAALRRAEDVLTMLRRGSLPTTEGDA